MKIFILLTLLFIFTGCIQNVLPWQKGTIAKETMNQDGGNALKVKFNEHIFISKESAKGGNGVSGGGCGCR